MVEGDGGWIKGKTPLFLIVKDLGHGWPTSTLCGSEEAKSIIESCLLLLSCPSRETGSARVSRNTAEATV